MEIPQGNSIGGSRHQTFHHFQLLQGMESEESADEKIQFISQGVH